MAVKRFEKIVSRKNISLVVVGIFFFKINKDYNNWEKGNRSHLFLPGYSSERNSLCVEEICTMKDVILDSFDEKVLFKDHAKMYIERQHACTRRKFLYDVNFLFEDCIYHGRIIKWT